MGGSAFYISQNTRWWTCMILSVEKWIALCHWIDDIDRYLSDAKIQKKTHISSPILPNQYFVCPPLFNGSTEFIGTHVLALTVLPYVVLGQWHKLLSHWLKIVDASYFFILGCSRPTINAGRGARVPYRQTAPSPIWWRVRRWWRNN